MPDRISRYLQARAHLHLPNWVVGPDPAEMYRCTVASSLVSVSRGVPVMRSLGDTAVFLPGRALSDEEVLRALVGGLKDILDG